MPPDPRECAACTGTVFHLYDDGTARCANPECGAPYLAARPPRIEIIPLEPKVRP